MKFRSPIRLMIARSSMVLSLLILSGCSILATAPPEPVATVEPEPVVEPEPEPQVEPEPPVEPPPPPIEPPPIVEPEPPTIEPLVAIVLSDRTPAYVDVADALQEFLEHHEIYDLSDRSMPPQDAFAAIAESNAVAVVAVGLDGAEAAARYSTVPVVVSQVFNIEETELLSERVKAVSVLPPLELLFEAWQEIDPTLKNVGAIIGPNHDDVIAEAEAAIEDRGINLHHAVAKTDRETLYVFNRLIRDIDGFILFPDNRILSRGVLTEMMAYASRHRVQVAVFNEPLLEFGAVFNSGSLPSDIAATITSILDEVLTDTFDSVPSITALSAAEIRTNPAVLQKFGLMVTDPTAQITLADSK
ncbi:MAG: hypothetical protein ACR2Q3_16650 [Woeseiaceae bacterium]